VIFQKHQIKNTSFFSSIHAQDGARMRIYE
jgi:hypothetical protein